jgi:hypothetical protein
VLARQGDLVLLIHPAGGAFTDRLLNLLAEVARTGGDGLRFTGLISAEFDADASSADPTAAQPGPAVVAFGPAGSGTAVAVYGAGWADITTGYGAQRLTTGQPYGRLRSVLPSPLVAVSAGVQAAAGGGETDPYMRLADGMVRAVGLVFAPAEAGQEPNASQHGASHPYADPLNASPSSPGPLNAGPANAGRFGAPGLAEPAADGLGTPDVHPPVLPAGGPPIPMPAAPEPAAPPGAEPFPELVEDQAPDGEYLATRLEPAVAAPSAPDQYAPHPEPPVPGTPGAGPGQPDPLIPGLAGDEAAGHDTEPAGSFGLSDPPTEIPAELPSSIAPAVVEGVYCANGHFNDPQARECGVCGVSMSQSPGRPQQGMRPPLGTLILDDGSMCQLDADCIIGREPTLDSAVAEGRARPLRITDASGVVSRMHAKVELDGWQAFITDLHSANGTQILRPGERHPTSLEPGVRAPLPGGTQIRLGGEFGLQYDSRRHA